MAPCFSGGPTGLHAPASLLFAPKRAARFRQPMIAEDTTTGTITIGGLNSDGSGQHLQRPDHSGPPPSTSAKSVTLTAPAKAKLDFTSAIPGQRHRHDRRHQHRQRHRPNTGIANVLVRRGHEQLSRRHHDLPERPAHHQ